MAVQLAKLASCYFIIVIDPNYISALRFRSNFNCRRANMKELYPKDERLTCR